MGVLVTIVILGLIVWATYAGYGRVLARKRYATRQREAPDLTRFAEGAPGANQRGDGPIEGREDPR